MEMYQALLSGIDLDPSFFDFFNLVDSSTVKPVWFSDEFFHSYIDNLEKLIIFPS